MDTSEIVAIEQLYALYGYVMDDRDWPRLGEVFTEDAVFDASAMGVPVMEGLAGIQAISSTTPKAPLAHHSTNILVESIDDGTATVRAKAIGMYSKGRAFSGEYADTLVKTDHGWRIRRRVNRPMERLEEGAA